MLGAMRAAVFGVLSAALLLPAGAAAEEAARESTHESRWYGYQTLAADGVALGLGLWGLAVGPPDSKTKVAALSLIIGGLVVYEFGAFTIHLIHGQEHNAKVSAGMRTLVPLVGIAVPLLLFGIGDRSGNDSGASGRAGVTYVLVGAAFVVPSIVDAVLAREAAPEPEARRSVLRSIAVIPSPGGGTLGVAGSF